MNILKLSLIGLFVLASSVAMADPNYNKMPVGYQTTGNYPGNSIEECCYGADAFELNGGNYLNEETSGQGNTNTDEKPIDAIN